MPKFHVEKSVTIEAPLDKVKSVLSDFDQWSAWSPWLLMEPEAKVTVRDDKKYYEWDGQRVGAGNMELLNEQTKGNTQSLTYSLNFLKPWKSYADVSFELSEAESGTKVTWNMDSSLPFFMFFMKKMMISWIGMDYQRGLNMLKEHVEAGHINSALSFEGESDFAGTHYIGITRECETQDIGPAMAGDFTQLGQFMENHADIANGNPMSIYHKWDMVKERCHYTAAIPVKSIPADIPDGMVEGEIPAIRVYTLRHTGDYLHVGNAWATLYTMERNKEFSCNKGIHPFEVYVNSPEEVDCSELITELKFPVK